MRSKWFWVRSISDVLQLVLGSIYLLSFTIIWAYFGVGGMFYYASSKDRNWTDFLMALAGTTIGIGVAALQVRDFRKIWKAKQPQSCPPAMNSATWGSRNPLDALDFVLRLLGRETGRHLSKKGA